MNKPPYDPTNEAMIEAGLIDLNEIESQKKADEVEAHKENEQRDRIPGGCYPDGIGKTWSY